MSPVPVASIDIPPEIFHLIASFVPLRSAPNTLRSWALGNRRFYDIIRPLLYSRLILRCEDHAITVIQKILDEPQLGLAVREIYILGLSIGSRQGQKPFDAITGLHVLVKKQLVHRIVALGIFLVAEWAYGDNSRQISNGSLLPDFWSDLRKECPCLHTLLLRNVGHSSTTPGLLEATIDERNCIPSFSVLRIELMPQGLLVQVNSKILKNIASLGSLLHTLSLESNSQNVNSLLPLNFPNLRWLSLSRFSSHNATSKVMDFFRRHPKLESLSLVRCTHMWFSMSIEMGFLPNLKHLKSWHHDVRILAPIHPQLVSLAIIESYNGQTPYFLRGALLNVLPQLKSLEIELYSQDWGREGAIKWHETLHEDIQMRKKQKKQKKIPRNLLNCMYDIARLMPNLIELGLHGIFLRPESLQAFGPALSQLVNVERFYYSGFYMEPAGPKPPPDVLKTAVLDFLSGVGALARLCTSLKSVTSINRVFYPYRSGIIDRDSAGNIKRIWLIGGVGMQISAHEDDPFPYIL